MFNKEVYIARRAELMRRLSSEKGVVLFLGNVDSPNNCLDNCYKWRQNSSWLYYFGIDEPKFAAILDLETGEQILFGDDYDIDDIIWTGPMPTVQSLAESVGITKTKPYSSLGDALKGRKVHFLPVSRYYNAMVLSKLLDLNPMELLTQGKKPSPHSSIALIKAVVDMRLVKDENEIELLDKACDLGYEMHTIARDSIKLGIKEQEIVGRMESVTLAKGWGISFQTILTQHGEIFHCHGHENLIEKGKLLVIDAGAELNEHYVSDFTRTYPTGGVFTSKQKDIYQIVLDANELAFSMIKPGITYRDVHLGVSRLMLDNLGQLGIVSGNIDDMVADGIAGLFMPHGLGHNMGLDVHDMEDLGENLVGYNSDQTRSSQLGLGSLRMARRLKPGNVITDEPGIYFIPDLINLWKKDGIDKGRINYQKLETYFDFGGIRLEDDVLVTSNGARRLGTKRLPITIDEIESIMN